MKTFKQLALILLIMSPAFAAAKETMSHDRYLQTSSPVSLVNQILNYGDDNPLTFCIEIKDDKIENTQKIEQNVFDSAKYAFNQWTKDIAAIIRKTNRSEEFADILQRLEKNYKINTESCATGKTYALKLILDEKNVPQYAVAAFDNFNKKENVIYFRPSSFSGSLNDRVPDSNRTPLSLVTHETGHAFGLADQYVFAFPNFNSLVYTTMKARPSIMDETQTVTCDDADGIITIFDRFTNTQREFNSLCGDKIRFRNGMEIITKITQKTFDDPVIKKPATSSIYLLNPATFQDGKYTLFQKRQKVKVENAKFMQDFYGLDQKIWELYAGQEFMLYMKAEITESRTEGQKYSDITEYIFDFGKEKYYVVTEHFKPPVQQKKITEKEKKKILKDYPNFDDKKTVRFP